MLARQALSHLNKLISTIFMLFHLSDKCHGDTLETTIVTIQENKSNFVENKSPSGSYEPSFHVLIPHISFSRLVNITKK
jgi:hypothetical protein